MRYIKRLFPYLLLYGIAFLWILPILWMTDTAFKPESAIFTIPPKWIPPYFTTYHIRRLFTEWPFLRWLLNSLIVSSFVTLGSLIVSVPAAFSFSRLRWRGRDSLFLVLLVFMLLPWQVNVVPLFFMMTKFGFLNTYQGVALPMIAMPIGLFLLRQFFINIPKDLEDAARIDGCSSLGVLFRVILPLSKPVLAAFSVYIFNYAWNEFFWSFICLRKPQMATLPIGLQLLQGAHEIDYGLIMAGTFMASLPSLAVFLLLRRQIIRGFTLAGSGVKG
ncbi:MAG TPA: carbohydrate ABC transporter permease [Candidatus Acetothermia bacterium]|nr:carbohydrate ABC transporter permease [Candidatus Acetothermia bacterium]